MSTGIVKSEKSSPNSVEVFWTIGKFGKKLEESNFLRSVRFYFAGHMWQPLLTTLDKLEDLRRIDFSISRITVPSEETPDSRVVCWNMEILDSCGRSHYGSTGFASLEIVPEWVRVADFKGPQFKDLCLKKDLYMPGDEITIAVRLILDSSHAFIENERASPRIMPPMMIDFVVIKVKGKTFYSEMGSILDGIANDIELKTSYFSTGRMTVIDLPDCAPDAFECFLSFAYYREVKGLTDDIAREVYDIADKFQVPELKRECVQRFLRTLNVSSACGFLEMAERYHDEALKVECSEYFLKNALEILNTSEWLEFMATRTKVANELIISYLHSIAR